MGCERIFDIPNEYMVILSTNQGDYIKIYENENGVFVKENDEVD